MTDLYAALGIARDASTDAIRRAYRQKAKTAHPDAGGSVEGFAALSMALDVLTDPERRARYNATGEFKASGPENTRAQAMGLIAQVLDAMLADQSDPFAVDMVAAIKATIETHRNGIREKTAEARRLKERAEKVAARLERKSGENEIARMLEVKAKVFADRLVVLETGERVAGMALEIVAEYQFERDVMPLPAVNFTTMTQAFTRASQARGAYTNWFGA